MTNLEDQAHPTLRDIGLSLDSGSGRFRLVATIEAYCVTSDSRGRFEICSPWQGDGESEELKLPGVNPFEARLEGGIVDMLGVLERLGLLPHVSTRDIGLSAMARLLNSGRSWAPWMNRDALETMLPD